MPAPNDPIIGFTVIYCAECDAVVATGPGKLDASGVRHGLHRGCYIKFLENELWVREKTPEQLTVEYKKEDHVFGLPLKND